jgi:hypothetical protein
MTATTTCPTLHSICFDYIKNHTEDLTSLDGVPYKPVVENLVKYLFTFNIPLNSTVLSIIAHSHSKAIRSANLPWTQFVFQTTTQSVHPMLKMISSHFPKFITHLRIGTTDLCDNDMYLLMGFTNLRVLDLKDNQNITDRGVSYLSGLALTNVSNGQGFPYLEEIYLDRIKGVTDKSLKFIGKLTSLSYVSLTGTQITSEVAIRFLTSRGFEGATKHKKSQFFQDQVDSGSALVNYKFYLFVEQSSYKYPIPAGRKFFKLSEKHVDNSCPALEFSRKVMHASITHVDNIPTVNGKRRPPTASKANNSRNKKPKANNNATTNDFLAMFESELGDDD